MKKVSVFVFLAVLFGMAHASGSFSPPSDPLAFVQGKWPQTRTGEGELEIVGNRVIVSQAAEFDSFGEREVGEIVFEIESFRIEPSDSQSDGFMMRVTGTKYSKYGDRVERSAERWLSFAGLRVDGRYRYRFVGGDRDLEQPTP
jgi:hypothetical protein